jgi:hypothetical protein
MALNKSFWESRTLFAKRVLAAGGSIQGKDPIKSSKKLRKRKPDGQA